MAGRKQRGQGRPKRGKRGAIVEQSIRTFPTLKSIVHHHVRMWDSGPISLLSTDAGGQITFQLAELPNYTEFTALYDQYRIDAVDCIWELQRIGILSGVAAYPVVIAYPDYDDGTAPSSLTIATQVAQAERMMFSQNCLQFERRLKPKLGVTVSSNVLVNQVVGMVRNATWLDTSTPNVDHFGLKFWTQNFNTTSTPGAVINLSFRFHLSMRNPK